jgi:heat shock protein HtpX
MKFAQVAKRVLLFIAVNILVMLTIHLVLHFTGLDRRFRGNTYGALMMFCLVWGMGGAFVSLALSRLMAKWMMGVQVIDPRTNDPELRDLVQTVHGLAQRARLPEMPQVGIYDSPEVNAFATGPSKSRSLVAVSTGLLRTMRQREVEGVLGHEVAHIANGDMVTMTLLQGVINAFVMFFAQIAAFVVSQALRSKDDDRPSYFLKNILYWVFYFVFSLLGTLIVYWFSRWREFRADAGGAQYAGREPMIGALRTLQRVFEHPEAVAAGEGRGAFQALKISSKPSGFLALFSTHPPIEQRIARLEAARG